MCMEPNSMEKDNEIVKDLRNAGWNNEQINYVMKKYSGKNTGMPGSAEKSFVNKTKCIKYY